jgi:hypothetical protein
MIRHACLGVFAVAILACQVWAEAPRVRRDMVGTYRHTHAYTSGTFTAVLEQYMVLKGDGTVLFYSNAGGGDANQTIGPGKAALVQSGTWRVEGKTIHLQWKTWRAEAAPFLFGDTGNGWRLAIGQPGGRKLWVKTR